MSAATGGLIAVTQRVEEIGGYRERRDATDQRWTAFLVEAGFLPLLLPNHRGAVERLLRAIPVDGVLLTGGNDLVACGGAAPERDETERWLLEWALDNGRPLIGVCRGMQVMQTYFGAQLVPVEGHVAARIGITGQNVARQVNSFHRWGAHTTPPPLETVASASDGVIKAVRHTAARLQGIMWHPEREDPFNPVDVEWVRSCFGVTEPSRDGGRAW